MYDTNTENILHTLTQHTRYVTTCAFAPNILLLATGSMDKTVNIWQFDTETLRQAKIPDQPKQFTENWSEDDVSNWLCAEGLEDLVDIFKMNNIDGRELLNLTKESLADDLKIDGYSYEKEAMENWISKKKRTSPMTNLVLSSVILTPNRTLKMAIDRWLSETHQK